MTTNTIVAPLSLSYEIQGFNSWATFSWLNFETMYPGGYTAEVTCLSPRATEKDVYDFFAHCGVVEHVEIIRSGEYSCTAYVTFKDAYALETAVLLSGAKIADQHVCISCWGTYIDESDPWNNPSWKLGDENSSMFASTPAEAITVAQEVVKTMVAKGYVLGKDALTKAKALDESYQVSSTAASKVVELSNRIGLTEKIYSGMEAVKSMDGKYHVSETTMTAASYTGRTAVAAANAVVNSSYFAKGALWVSDVLTRAASVAADLGSHGVKK
ncbi:binding partner of ACD11 1-like isoform X2 [Camellia sinensis]|uniref:binding partner of ACD11 1-like isoform X2 n=1 Tax=Camellia sinensis TaxID=4442 RepID=UPI001035D87B|nr:binding partner of ACD11 1-like isoform X2 [Camellia sinensis]